VTGSQAPSLLHCMSPLLTLPGPPSVSAFLLLLGGIEDIPTVS